MALGTHIFSSKLSYSQYFDHAHGISDAGALLWEAHLILYTSLYLSEALFWLVGNGF